MELKTHHKKFKTGNDLLSFENQIDEAIVFINSILGNFQTLKSALESNVEFSQDEVDEVQTALDNSKTKIKNYADSL